MQATTIAIIVLNMQIGLSGFGGLEDGSHTFGVNHLRERYVSLHITQSGCILMFLFLFDFSSSCFPGPPEVLSKYSTAVFIPMHSQERIFFLCFISLHVSKEQMWYSG